MARSDAGIWTVAVTVISPHQHGGTRDGQAQKMAPTATPCPGLTGRMRFLRQPKSSACPPGLSALAIGGNCPSITFRGGFLRLSLRQRRQQSDSWREARAAGGWRLESLWEGAGYPAVLVSSRSSVPRFSVFLRDSPSKGFRMPDVLHNPPPPPPRTSSNL